MVELPLVVIDVQRAGPSTGMPTKNEQADLLQVMFGRNCDSPIPIVAPATPGECFDFAIEAWRIALKYMTPVVYLSDAFLATGSEPWRVPAIADLPGHRASRTRRPTTARSSRTSAIPRRSPGRGPCRARPGSSTASAGSRRPTSPATSATTRTTTTGCSCCAQARSPASPTTSRRSRSSGPTEGDLLILGWGSTYGAIRSAVERLQADGRSVAHAHLRHLNPFPANTEDGPAQLPPGAHPGGQPGPAAAAHPGTYLIDASATTGSAASRSGSPRSSRRPSGCSRRHDRMTTETERQRRRRPGAATPSAPENAAGHRAHAQGLRVRPGGPLVPGLRRLLDPRPDPEGDARLRLPEGEHRVHQRHRLLRPAAVLHEHVRLPHDPRPRADAGDRPQGRPPGPDGLGHHRRRRRAVDRRQPRAPLDAPQRRHQAGDVQQPDLRPDQGPGVADLGVRQEDQVDAGRHDRHADHAADHRPRGRGDVRRPLGRHPHRAPPGDARARRPPQGLVVRRGPPELQHLQRRRVARLHRPRGPRGPDARPRARQADDLRQGPRQGHPARRPAPGGRDDRARTASPRRTCWSTTRPPRTPTSRSCCRGCSGRSSRCRSASSARPAADPRPAARGPDDGRGRAGPGRATWNACFEAARHGRSSRRRTRGHRRRPGGRHGRHQLPVVRLREPHRGRQLRQLRRRPGRP